MEVKLQKAIICLAAGKSQVLVIRKAKEMGFKVIAVDRNPEAVGFKLVDEKIMLSTYDPNPIIDHIRKLKKYKPMGVINRSSGLPVVTAAEINKSFGLPGVEPLIAKKIISKSELNRVCRKKNIAVPECQAVKKLTEVKWDEIKYPCVIKPSLSLIGKSGVNIVKTEGGLRQVFQESIKVSYDGWVNIEEYIEGYDISLMAIVHEGKLVPIVLLDELNRIDSTGRLFGAGFAVPSIFTGAIEEVGIIDLAKDIVNKLDLFTTVFIMACRCKKGGLPYLIEIHLDLGGDLILDELLPASSDFDFIKYAMNILTGNPAYLSKQFFSSAAIIYGEGDGLVNERPFKLLKGDNRATLENILREFSCGQRYALLN